MSIETIRERDLTESIGGSWVNYGSCIRRKSPEETLRAILPLAASFGVTRVADVTGLDSIGIAVALAVRPRAKSLSVSQGKGTSLEAAKVSALLESIEIHHAEHLATPDQVASANEVQRLGLAMATPAELDPLNGTNVVWNTDSLRSWYRGLEMHSRTSVLIPELMLSLDSTRWDSETAHYEVTTNGLASGNDFSEAFSHSVFELIERHAFSYWIAQSPSYRADTGVALASLGSDARQLVARIQGANMELTVFHLAEASLGLPCYVAEITNPNDPLMPARPYTGRGLHVSSEIAVGRAITEAAQSRLTMISGARDDNLHEDYFIPRSRTESSSTREFSPTDANTLASWLSNPIEFLLSRLRDSGFPTCVAYAHRAAPPFYVVRCFIPGMRHDS